MVRIVWDDAFAAPQGWIDPEEYVPKTVHPVTIGWLIPRMLEGYISTADTYLISEDSIQYYGVGHIPMGMVRSLDFIDIPDKISRRKKKGA